MRVGQNVQSEECRSCQSSAKHLQDPSVSSTSLTGYAKIRKRLCLPEHNQRWTTAAGTGLLKCLVLCAVAYAQTCSNSSSLLSRWFPSNRTFPGSEGEVQTNVLEQMTYIIIYTLSFSHLFDKSPRCFQELQQLALTLQQPNEYQTFMLGCFERNVFFLILFAMFYWTGTSAARKKKTYIHCYCCKCMCNKHIKMWRVHVWSKLCLFCLFSVLGTSRHQTYLHHDCEHNDPRSQTVPTVLNE